MRLNRYNGPTALRGITVKPTSDLRKEDTLPPPCLVFDPQHIREPRVEDLVKLNDADWQQLQLDAYLYGCTYVGEQNGITIRVDPTKVREISHCDIPKKIIYEYEARK